MRLLVFDHFYQQDISAIRGQLSDDDSLEVIPYRRLHRIARSHFPEEMFTGVRSAYGSDAHRYWHRYTPVAERFADWLAAAYEPSLFVVPSDAFFYLRPVISRFANLGVRTVVVQKETSIAPMIMDLHSLDVGASVPFMSDAMTVCSERHKEFWIRSGAEPDRILVTGQPRFDVYAGRTRSRAPRHPPEILYLSYDDVAYLPQDVGQRFDGDWQNLRRDTEQVLARLAAGGLRVRAKPHPQQHEGEDWLGGRVERIPRDADTRRHILAADAVVAFQTTTVYEAAVAGKPVVYPAWGPVFDRAREWLLPFHRQPDLVTHATSADELESLLGGDIGGLARSTPSGRAIAEEHLGPVDGHATERVIRVLRENSGGGPTPIPAVSASLQVRAALAGAAAPMLRATARVAAAAERADVARALKRRSDHWSDEGRELTAVRRRRG